MRERKEMNRGGKSLLDLTEGVVFTRLLFFSLPIVATNILQTTYNLVDMAIVGRYLGSVGLSAVSVGSDILQMITLVCNGLSAAAQIIISQHMGAKDNVSVNKSAGTIFGAGIIFSLILTVTMLAVNKTFLEVLNTPLESWSEAVRYTVVCYLGIVFILGYGILAALLRGIGDSRHPLMFIIVTSVVNVVLDYIFVGRMNMGTFGAALATVAGQGTSFFWAAGFIYTHRDILGLEISRRMFRIDREILITYTNLAIPMSLQRALVQVANLYVHSFIYAYGVIAVAVTGVGSKLGTICQIFTNAFIQGGSAMIGQNVGAGKQERVRKIVYINMIYAMVVGCFFSSLSIIFREELFGLFTTEALVLEMSKLYLPALILRYFMFCVRCPFMALINGIGKPSLNYILGVMDGLVLRVGGALVMGLFMGMGMAGFWYGNALGGFAPLIVGGVYFFSGSWKKDASVKMRQENL